MLIWTTVEENPLFVWFRIVPAFPSVQFQL